MPVLTHIPQLVEEHFEELAFLFHLREVQKSSGLMPFRHFIDLDDRIQGHIDGLLAVPESAMALARIHLVGTDPLNLRAAAYVLLRLDPAGSADSIFAKLGSPETAPPIFAALLTARPADMLARLKKLAADTANPLLAASATEVLAEASPGDVTSASLNALLSHATPAVRAAAWQAAQRHPEPRIPALYKAGFIDADPSARNAALLAGAWAAQPGVLEACRPFLKKTTPDALVPLHLFAVLAPPAEIAPLLPEFLKAIALGPARFDLLATSGSPSAIAHLLAAMRLDPETASAAAAAFGRLTNYQPPEKNRVPAKGGLEEADDIILPDADAAASYWSSIAGTLGNAARINRGQIIDPAPEPTALLDLDCAARDAIILRSLATPAYKKIAAARWNFPQRI